AWTLCLLQLQQPIQRKGIRARVREAGLSTRRRLPTVTNLPHKNAASAIAPSAFADLRMYAVHKQVKRQTRKKQQTRDDGAWNRGFAMPCKKGLQRRGEQPDLDDQQRHDQNHGSVNRCEPAILGPISDDRDTPIGSALSHNTRRRKG